MPSNNSKTARYARAERALIRARWTLGQYRQGIFRPEQTKHYNPTFSEDDCIAKTELTIKNTERHLEGHYTSWVAMPLGPEREKAKERHFALNYGTPIT